MKRRVAASRVQRRTAEPVRSVEGSGERAGAQAGTRALLARRRRASSGHAPSAGLSNLRASLAESILCFSVVCLVTSPARPSALDATVSAIHAACRPRRCRPAGSYVCSRMATPVCESMGLASMLGRSCWPTGLAAGRVASDARWQAFPTRSHRVRPCPPLPHPHPLNPLLAPRPVAPPRPPPPPSTPLTPAPQRPRRPDRHRPARDAHRHRARRLGRWPADAVRDRRVDAVDAQDPASDYCAGPPPAELYGCDWVRARQARGEVYCGFVHCGGRCLGVSLFVEWSLWEWEMEVERRCEWQVWRGE